ncbi:hypothetical protein [Natronomonas sp. EA1]|uniref:hypothetical protein n=1 Tax=Natronomonas sp. EA1 TaxID=3421655 RepID=UPI003EC01DC6
MASYTYVCPECGNTVEREYRVPSIIRTCESGCGFDHYVRAELADAIAEVPEESRPDDWDDLTSTERLLVAFREGFLSMGDVR